VKFKVYQAEDP